MSDLGDVYVMKKTDIPEFFGKFPIKTETTIIKCDSGIDISKFKCYFYDSP